MVDMVSVCAACGEPGRLNCAGCGRTFCVEHLVRHFAMGYFYFCAECLAQQPAADQEEPPKRRRKRAPNA